MATKTVKKAPNKTVKTKTKAKATNGIGNKKTTPQKAKTGGEAIKSDEPKPKHAGGRPPKYSTLEELEAVIEAYFIWCDQHIYPYTITGLAMALDLTRRGLLDYEGKPEFSHAIKQAKQKCRWFVEKELFLGKNQSAMIFWLKNNDDWKDKTEHEVTGANGANLFKDIQINLVG